MQPMRRLKEDFSVLSVGRAVPPFCADSPHGGEFFSVVPHCSEADPRGMGLLTICGTNTAEDS